MHWERFLLLLKGEEQKVYEQELWEAREGNSDATQFRLFKIPWKFIPSRRGRDQMSRGVLRHPSPLQLPYSHLQLIFQGDLGPFNPGLPVEVPVWLAINLKQRQKCRLIPPEWMDVGKDRSFQGYKGNTEKSLVFTTSGELN